MKYTLIASVLLIGFIFGITFPDVFAEPKLTDENLILQEFTREFGWGYTTMAFVEDDILVLEKNGSVYLIRDEIRQDKPVLNVQVDPVQESGLLGITSVGSTVYLYFTEADKDGNQLGNRIYKYDWNEENLVNPVLLKELPANSYHNSGAMVTGLDDQVYAVVGDTGKYGPLQNKSLEDLYPPGTPDYMDTSVILRVDPEGPYQAIGVRNSFGLAIDPITGNLWATENGDDDFDEVNLVPDKFNSGWNQIMGPATESELAGLPGYKDYVYGDPKFSWEKVVSPVGISFGKFKETSNYDNSIFVGDCNNGNLYKFELNENRDGFEFSDPNLQDNLVNKGESMDEIIIGTGFRCITDIERGPDGFLYLISHGEKNIYRILPIEALALEEENISDTSNLDDTGGGCLIATATFGSELAPQVQQLRELRDNQLMQTSSGMSFMNTFNDFYYSFSPMIADYERENPVFRETVKIVITPLIASLLILNHLDIDSESKVLGYGISLIVLNFGMYFVAPALAIVGIRKKL
ncbi:PQQ-dependent sugar dehydrogenase [Nitrosopumilus sp.]|uniref:PQQ-dependent sugar dehydrogenase n=1 Tax=Nitrosopumilus sp. TaxID=2024843 RepID=UPI00292E4618|nr:PQQ-dependent sugar dehydrogenase [Nitrosopumilus sp.]